MFPLYLKDLHNRQINEHWVTHSPLKNICKENVKHDFDQKIRKFVKDSQKDSYIKVSALYGVSKSLVLNMIKRKTVYMDSFECDA